MEVAAIHLRPNLTSFGDADDIIRQKTHFPVDSVFQDEKNYKTYTNFTVFFLLIIVILQVR